MDKDIKQKSNKKIITKKIIIIVIIVIILVAAILLYIFKDTLFSKTSYVPYNQRQSYIIKDVNDDFLSKYLSDKNVLVICWASWCSNCKEDANAISEFIKQKPDAEIIIVAHDPEESDLEAYLKENSRNWFVIYDPEKKIREHLDPGKTTIPNTYLLNKKGEVINKYEGKMTYDELTRFYNGETITNVDED